MRTGGRAVPDEGTYISSMEWDAHVKSALEANLCPYSGLEGPECKSWLCDCFEFEDRWGRSKK
jgi:hypothetical protein